MKSVYLWLTALVCALLLNSCTLKKEELIEKIQLSDNWKFRLAENSDAPWHEANVPGTVHTDLLKNGLIPDPFYGCNENIAQWIGQTDWVYQNTFKIDQKLLDHNQIRLVFEGLDTYAKLSLNGNHLLSTDNMFRRWEANCKPFLQAGDNILEIVFSSASNRFYADSLAYDYVLPGGKWVFARKAAYHFGWDWGPKFITSGIWKPVYLELWNQHRPLDIQLQTNTISEEQAGISAVLCVKSETAEQAEFVVTELKSNKKLLSETFDLNTSQEDYAFDFLIDNPVLWWPNGLGEPHLYELSFELKTKSGFTWSKQMVFGIRNIGVISGQDAHGQSLYVKVNGVPVFLKGANYIPQHSFVTEVSDDDYRQIIQRAVESNMNMIRVWGGGIYEKDIFYDLCDRNGILVWQDFMFACAMYPGDDAFVANVKAEATDQIRRLRNHTCLALWCGNNEIDEGWHNWQWQKAHNISAVDSARIWEGYLRVFHKTLPEAIVMNDPGRFYLPSSPMFGWGRKESLTHGSAHYWGVWWGVQPPEMYLEKVPRLMSEYGLQALPNLSTIRAFQAEDEDFLFSASLKCHQKHPTGYENIYAYLQMENLRAENLEDLIYKSQLVQARGIGLAIEAHRRAMPYCMGTLYWQLNDCWPVTSWSGTDVFGNWKALQYRVRELFKDILVTVIDHKGRFEVHVVSDRLKNANGKLELSIVDFQGNRTRLFSENITAMANSSMPLISENSDDFFQGINKEQVVVEAIFTDENGRQYVNQKFLTAYGNLKLPEANISKKISPVKEGYNITLKSGAFAAHVQLYLSESHAWFDDNFVNLFPNEEITIFCKTDLSLEQFSEQLILKHL